MKVVKRGQQKLIDGSLTWSDFQVIKKTLLIMIKQNKKLAAIGCNSQVVDLGTGTGILRSFYP